MTARVDSHCHLWRQSRGDYGWLDPQNEALAPLLRDFEPSDLQERLAASGIESALVVQAAPTVDETRFLLSLAATTPQIVGVVGWVDLADAGSIKILEELALDSAFKGVRPMLQDLEQVDWIATSPDQSVVNRMIELGVRFDALVLAQHLPHLLSFAKRYADLPIVVDHAAKPALSDQGDLTNWRAGLIPIAKETNAVCKISGLLTEMAPVDLDRAETVLAPVVSDLLDWFGPERLMWGSDWPVLKLAGSYRGWDDLTQKLLSDLSETDRARILGGTATEFYGLEDAA